MPATIIRGEITLRSGHRRAPPQESLEFTEARAGNEFIISALITPHPRSRFPDIQKSLERRWLWEDPASISSDHDGGGIGFEALYASDDVARQRLHKHDGSWPSFERASVVATETFTTNS
jgi:hypothetical protein